MITTKVEAAQDSRSELTVTISADQVADALASVYKNLAKEVRIPGFRPGKAPRKMIEQTLGSDYALTQVAEDLINATYAQALDKESLRVVGQPEFKDPEPVVEGEEFTYALTVATRPVLTLSDVNVEITMPPRETTDAEIDAQIEQARERLAGLEPVEDRAIEAHDFAMISFTSTLDGEDYEGSSVDKYLYELGQGLMPEQFEEAIIGAQAGDKVVSEFKVENGNANEEFVGKTIHFDIEIHEVKQKVLPEVNDEFAVSSGFENLEDMRADIKDYLDSQKTQSYDRIRDERLMSNLADKLQGDVPSELVETQKARMKRDFEEMLKQQNMSFDQYLAITQTDADAYDANLEAQAAFSVREDLALEALAAQEKIEATEEDIDKEFLEVANALHTTVDDAHAKWDEFGLNTSLKDDIVRRKALEWLRENATITIDEQAQ